MLIDDGIHSHIQPTKDHIVGIYSIFVLQRSTNESPPQDKSNENPSA